MSKKTRPCHSAHKRGIGRTTALSMVLSAAALFALLQAAIADTTPAPLAEDNGEPAMHGLEQGSLTRTAPESGRFTKAELRKERRIRFSRRALDDLQNSLGSAREDITELEREVGRIALLESPKRETDLGALLTIYMDYADWLKDEIGDIQTYMSTNPDGDSLPGSDWRIRYGGIIARQQEFAYQADTLVKSHTAELQRLTEIIDRRRLLRDRSMDLEMRLTDMENALKQLKPSSPSWVEREGKARRYREELRIAQTELLALDDIDENLLKHLAVMIERERGCLDWLALKTDEYLMLGEVSEVIDRDTSRDAPAMESAYRRVIRGFEKEKNRLRRTIDQLDRKRELVTPAGTLRDVDRSREMLDFLEQVKGRYSREMRRVDLQIGVWETELSEALSTK